jgi:hypothetical protein
LASLDQQNNATSVQKKNVKRARTFNCVVFLEAFSMALSRNLGTSKRSWTLQARERIERNGAGVGNVCKSAQVLNRAGDFAQ